MEASIAEPGVLERIGHALTEPLPAAIREVLSPYQQPDALLALVDVLAHYEQYEIIERGGEL